MTNKEYLKCEIEKHGYKIGCYDPTEEKLGKRTLNRIINAWLDHEATHVQATVNGLKYIIMLDTVDNEKDINMLTVSDYYSQFGN